MAPCKVFRCIVDDSALITNISEIKNWITNGAIALVVPLHTLERLHLLKKDTSQIGINAREAVKFLDRVTSGQDGLSTESIVLQGPEEQYLAWSEVEGHLKKEENENAVAATESQDTAITKENVDANATSVKVEHGMGSAGNVLSQMLLSKLNFAKESDIASNLSTPPSSPLSSGPQSSKTSPEVKNVELIEAHASIVPPVLKPLVNSVVWYTYEKLGTRDNDLIFLTNKADTASLARDFGITTRNIHQLRTGIVLEEQEMRNQGIYQKKHSAPPSPALTVEELEPKALFKYEEDSDEEVVVFKPRGNGAIRGPGSAKGSTTASVRGKNGLRPSPVLAHNRPVRMAQPKPEIPTEEIDPDSFDRGSFGRGSVPLANTGNQNHNQFHTYPRGAPFRGYFGPTPRGGFYRGTSRGFDRGSTRGRGRLFVP